MYRHLAKYLEEEVTSCGCENMSLQLPSSLSLFIAVFVATCCLVLCITVVTGLWTGLNNRRKWIAVSSVGNEQNESVPKIITNNTMYAYLFFKTTISILVISDHNSFRVLFFDKIASKHFISKIYLYFSIGNGQPSKPALCQLYRHTFIPNMILLVY